LPLPPRALSLVASSPRRRRRLTPPPPLHRSPPRNLETNQYKQNSVAGYFQLNRTYDAHMFYLYYSPRHPTGRALTKKESDAAPVVLWMTGGPGCSSEIAVLYGECQSFSVGGRR
jgi:hypothetical protein